MTVSHNGEGNPGNWGRWGTDDQRGAANLVTPDRTLSALSLPTTGRVIPLGLSLDGRTPAVGRPAPQHFMTLDGGDFAAGVRLADGAYQAADDHLSVPCHGGTHLDGLAHVWYDHLLYNGVDEAAVRSYGATRLGIENLGHLVTRGVLIDVAAGAGVDRLEPDTIVTRDLLQQASRSAPDLLPGDAVLIRTGWLGGHLDGSFPDPYVTPGIDEAAATWLAERDVCLVGADNLAVEATTGLHRYAAGSRAPVAHRVLIRDHGTYLLEMLVLDRLVGTTPNEFLFLLAPLPITGGTASPVNPLIVY